jgi:hypothetical protein
MRACLKKPKEICTMKRREFVAASCLAGLAPLGSVAAAQAGDRPAKEFYELRYYYMEAGAKQKQMDDFLRDAAIPALNRIGIAPVGVFRHMGKQAESPNLYILMPHNSIESVATLTARLGADGEFLQAGAAVLDATLADPAYKRMESSLMVAFDEIPKLELPTKAASRVFQFRIYEAHSVKKGQKKIDMFNSGGELAIFRRTGMNPVFFGESLIGAKMPNLTYMLGFDNMQAGEQAWARFLKDPAWIELKADPQYKDTVSNITNLFLRPAPYSQI